jgi:S-formylglutathione hydrolase
MKLTKTHKSFEGESNFYYHQSKFTKSLMNFSAFLPNKNPQNCIIFLSGLTCTPENFITKSGVQNHLKNTNTMIICPDTSPRGLEIEGENESYDFGTGASFYVNATTKNYAKNYQMYDYISSEIHEIITQEFGVKSDKISIMGHSMGGHGALVLGLNEPEKYQAISAFSPITNPTKCDWGKKAFLGYLGNDENSWQKYDACKLVKSGKKHQNTILIDQGLNDEFLEKQLLTENFAKICQDKWQKTQINFREGYDHSYYFIATFLKSHIDFHLSNF